MKYRKNKETGPNKTKAFLSKQTTIYYHGLFIAHLNYGLKVSTFQGIEWQADNHTCSSKHIWFTSLLEQYSSQIVKLLHFKEEPQPSWK